MRTPNDAVGSNHGFYSVLLDKLMNLGRDNPILSKILVLRKPTLQRLRLAAILNDDPDGNFGGPLVIRPVPRDGGDRESLKAAPCFLLQRGTTFESHASTMVQQNYLFFYSSAAFSSRLRIT
jgi:hypothetical protein